MASIAHAINIFRNTALLLYIAQVNALCNHTDTMYYHDIVQAARTIQVCAD